MAMTPLRAATGAEPAQEMPKQPAMPTLDDAPDAVGLTEPSRWLMTLNMSYEDMLRATADWLWECNGQAVLTFVSPPLGSNLARVPSPMRIGHSLTGLAPLQQRASGDPALAETLESRLAFRDTRFTFGAPDDEEQEVYCLSGVPLYDRQTGQFLGYRGTGVRAPERVAAGASAAEPDQQLLNLLENALARKDQLEWELSKTGQKTIETRLAAIAHELRTPLNAIIGFAEIIKRRMPGEQIARYADYGKDIHDSAMHMAGLINNLIDLANMEPHGRAAEDEPFDIHEIVAGALRMLEEQGAESGITLFNNLPTHLPQIRSEPQALRQIILNLLSNAIKYTRRGGAVGIEADAIENDGLDIVVWDTGIGIAPDEQERIFERAYRVRTPANEDKGGSGLGLAISREMARSLGGDIMVQSKPGQGARFTLRVPCKSRKK